MARTAIADASALISLEHIGQLPLLQKLFGEVVVPPSVAREAAPSLSTLPPWILVRGLAQPLDPRIDVTSLGAGETEALGLALEVAAEWVILDDLRARVLARRLGVPILGTAAVLCEAKRRGFLPAV
jgi:predicted nucleic acid-binding protein